MKSAQTLAPRPTVAARFRAEIEKASAQGVALDHLTLHLTLGDVEQLKRDRAVAMADISFFGGTMTFLGVEVLKGEVPLSVLRIRVADEA